MEMGWDFASKGLLSGKKGELYNLDKWTNTTLYWLAMT